MSHRKRSTKSVSRRAFLRGCGATLTLPWLESLAWAADPTGQPATNADDPPVRFACLFFSNGVEPAHWWAEGEGAAMRLGPGLQPMQKHCQEMVFLRGLYNAQAAAHKSAHLGRSPNLLSGAWVSTNQNEIRVGKSFDQVLAQTVGKQTAVSSLVLGIEPTELRLEDGLSMLYGSNISWVTDTKPATKEIYPARVFDLLVGDRRGRQSDRSVLDEVLADANDLKRRVSRSDGQKIEEYLESVRSIETRIAQAGKDGRLEGWQPTLTSPNMARPGDALPQDIPVHMRLMLDLIVLAFQMDKTRIATCMLNYDLSQMNFGFLEGVRGSLHLDLTHNGRAPELEAMYLKTNQFHVAQFAYLVDRLKAIDEGGRSLLDNSVLMCCSNFFDGDKHQADHMPMLLAGRAGSRLQTGRVLDYLAAGDDNRRACSLYLSLMELMGAPQQRFGDADQRLARQSSKTGLKRGSKAVRILGQARRDRLMTRRSGMNVRLTAEQLQAVRYGQTVHVRVPELAMECVVVRADLYARVQTVIDETVGEDEVARLVEASMREYDEDDPALDSYQKYRRG